MMLDSKKIYPGQPGTKHLVNQYGARLVCVRYRYDAAQAKRFKTVEIIVEEADWQPPTRQFQDAERVGIRVGLEELQWRQRVKAAGGRWNPNRKLWELEYGKVRKLGLTGRIQTADVSANGKVPEPERQAKVSAGGKPDVSACGK
jgi:hypothetical protein